MLNLFKKISLKGLNALILSVNYSLPCLNLPGFPCYENVTSSISQYITNFYQFGIGLAIILALGFLVYGGLMYSFSGVIDKKREAKTIILSSIGGIVLIFSAVYILNILNPRITKLVEPELKQLKKCSETNNEQPCLSDYEYEVLQGFYKEKIPTITEQTKEEAKKDSLVNQICNSIPEDAEYKGYPQNNEIIQKLKEKNISLKKKELCLIYSLFAKNIYPNFYKDLKSFPKTSYYDDKNICGWHNTTKDCKANTSIINSIFEKNSAIFDNSEADFSDDFYIDNMYPPQHLEISREIDENNISNFKSYIVLDFYKGCGISVVAEKSGENCPSWQEMAQELTKAGFEVLFVFKPKTCEKYRFTCGNSACQRINAEKTLYHYDRIIATHKSCPKY